jgi:transposase
MRVAELFNRLLAPPGARVVAVELEQARAGPVVVVRLVRPAGRVGACSGCGQLVRRVHDRGERRWRHLDLAGRRCEIVAEVRRLRCPACGVRAEVVPWARPGGRFSRPFEDTCAFLARAAPQSVVAAMMRIDWGTVGRIAARVVDEQRAGSDGLDGLRRIGVDEVSWRAGHHYLTVVVCHDSRRVVWVGRGDRRVALERFFDQLGPERAARIEAVSADLGPAYLEVIGRRCPGAEVCADPFHVLAAAQFALDRLRAAEWQRLRREDPGAGRWLKGTRFALRRGPARRTDADRALIDQLAEANAPVYRAHLWCDQLRATLRSDDPEAARAQLVALAEQATTLGHRRFTRMAGSIRRHLEQIVSTIRRRLSNGRIEALNSTVRLISHRARGFRRVEHLIGLIHLTCGRVEVALPT